MVGTGTYVLRHTVDGEEHTGAPLYVKPLACVRIVAHPELFKVRHETIVDTSASACTALDDQIGIFLADALECLDDAQLIVNVQMTLLVGRQVVRTEIGDVIVAVPFDVISVGGLLHDVVHHFEYEVLHFGIAHVQSELCASTSRQGLA